METNTIYTETPPIPRKIRLPYRIISIFFGVVALLTLWSAIYIGSRNFFMPSFLISMAYACLNGIMAFGFWKMKKWIMSLLVSSTIIVAVVSVINIISGVISDINLTPLAILIALFIFAYFSRKFLDGDYKNPKVLGLFWAFLIFIQVIILFLK